MQRWQKSKTGDDNLLDCGEKEAAIVIWKSENPRCFRYRSKFPVQYFSQPKGWLTGEIFDKVLSKLDQKLRSKGCSNGQWWRPPTRNQAHIQQH